MDRSDLRIPLFFGLVCKDCFEADYKNIKLLTTKCSQSQKCTIVLLIHVAVNDEGMLERIRPLPKRLSPGKRFSMCMNARGSCNRGGSCTYAHSRLEQKVWNTQLRRPEVDWKRGSELSLNPNILLSHYFSSVYKVLAFLWLGL